MNHIPTGITKQIAGKSRAPIQVVENVLRTLRDIAVPDGTRLRMSFQGSEVILRVSSPENPARLGSVLAELLGATTTDGPCRPLHHPPPEAASDPQSLPFEPPHPETVPPETETALEAALDRLAQRHRIRVADILRRPDMLTAEAIGRQLGLSRETVNRRRQEKKLLGLKGAKRGYRYPAWQVTPAGDLLPELERVLQSLPHDPWMQYDLIVTDSPAGSGRSPLKHLQAGEVDKALAMLEASISGAFD